MIGAEKVCIKMLQSSGSQKSTEITPNVVKGYCENGFIQKASQLFKSMLHQESCDVIIDIIECLINDKSDKKTRTT